MTTSDAEKLVVLDHGMFAARVRDQLATAGVRTDLTSRASVTAESEETVARDFEGSWFYAMR